MATPTPLKGLSLPAIGGDSAQWGGELNVGVIGALDNILGNAASVSLSSAPYTIGTNAIELQSLVLKLNGTLVANIIVSSPVIGFYIVENNTTGNFTVTWQANFGPGPVGSGIVIPQGVRTWIVSDISAGARVCPTWLANLQLANLQAANFLLATGGSIPLLVRRTENDTTERTAAQVQIGNGSGNSLGLNVLGDGSNNVTNARFYIGGTRALDLSSSSITMPLPLILPSLGLQAPDPYLRPQGRLTLTSGTPVIASDVIGTSTVFYTPYEGDLFPVWNGANFVPMPFTEIALTLTAALASNSIVDVFGINSSGSAAIGFGPVWSNSGAGTGSRGTGAGTTQLARQKGILTNAQTISLTNGTTSYSNVPPNQATYLGSIFGDSTPGQVTCHISFGQSRKFAVWNAYNRKPVALVAGDATGSWSYSGPFRASNNNTANSISEFTGLAEELISTELQQLTLYIAAPSTTIGIGWNTTTASSGLAGTGQLANGANGLETLVARYLAPPSLGLNTVTSLETANHANATFFGTQPNMQLAVSYLA